MAPSLLLGSLVLLSTTAYAANDLPNCIMTGLIAEPARIMTTGSEIKGAINVCKTEDTVKCMAQITEQIGRWGLVAGDIAQLFAKCGNDNTTKDDFASCSVDVTKFVANVGLVISSVATVGDDCDGSDSDSDVDSDADSPSTMGLAICGAQVAMGGNELYGVIDGIMKAKDSCNSTNTAQNGGASKCAAQVISIFNEGAAAMVSISTAVAECTGTSMPATKCTSTVAEFIESVAGLATSAAAIKNDCQPAGWRTNSVLTRFDMGLNHLSTLAALKKFQSTAGKNSVAGTVLMVVGAFASVTLIGFAMRKALRTSARNIDALDPEAEEGLVAE